MTRLLARSALLVLSCFLLFLTLQRCVIRDPPPSAPLYFETLGDGLKIPTGYESYTLFFATSHAYADTLSKSDQAKLRELIQRFGKNIKKENLGVWVCNSDGSLNVELGKTYLDRIYDWYGEEYQYSQGPYLVFYTAHPNNRPTDNDFVAVISFHHKSWPRTIETVEYVESQIRRRTVSKAGMFLMDYWFDIKSLVDRNPDLAKEIAIAVLKVSVGDRVRADELDAQKKALDILSEFADKICSDIPLHGSTKKIELSGKAKAELPGIIKKLADLGLQGAAKYQNAEYKGVLQSDLAKILKDSRDCKLKVLDELKDKLIPTRKPSEVSPSSTGDIPSKEGGTR